MKIHKRQSHCNRTFSTLNGLNDNAFSLATFSVKLDSNIQSAHVACYQSILVVRILSLQVLIHPYKHRGHASTPFPQIH